MPIQKIKIEKKSFQSPFVSIERLLKSKRKLLKKIGLLQVKLPFSDQKCSVTELALLNCRLNSQNLFLKNLNPTTALETFVSYLNQLLIYQFCNKTIKHFFLTSQDILLRFSFSVHLFSQLSLMLKTFIDIITCS